MDFSTLVEQPHGKVVDVDQTNIRSRSSAMSGGSLASPKVYLSPAGRQDLDGLGKRLQEAFTRAAIAELGDDGDGPIPSDADIDESFSAPGAEILHVMYEGQSVGGVVVTFLEEGHKGSLDFFFSILISKEKD